MKSSFPWSVRGIDERTREAALEAARQARMSVGEWLNQAIAERAAEEGVEPPRRSAREFDDDDEAEAGAIAAAVDKLTRRLRAMDATSRAAISGLKDRLDEIEGSLSQISEQRGGKGRSLKGVSAMVDQLSREVDNADERARSMIEGLRARGGTSEAVRGGGTDRVQDAIRDLDQRIAQMGEGIQSPPKPADSNTKLEDIRYRLNALLATGAQPAQPPRVAAIDATLRSLEARIDEAKSRLAGPRVVTPPPIFAGEDEQIGRIEARLAAISGRLDQRRPQARAGAAPPVHSGNNLAEAIAEISAHQRVLDEHAETLAMRRDQKALTETIATLRADIAGLAQKIGNLDRNGTEDQEAYFGLARRLDALIAERPLDRDLLTKMRSEIEALRAAAEGGDRGRLDALGAEVSALRRQLEATDNPATMTRLEMRIGELARNLDAVVSSRYVPTAAIERLEGRLDEIAARIDGVLDAVPAKVQAPMQDKLAALIERLERMATPQPQPLVALDEIKREIAGIRREMVSRTPPSTSHLEQQIRELATRLETASRPEAGNAALSQLEAQVAHLSAELERSLPRTVALSQVEENLARMQAHLSDNRQESVEAARAAAREAVRELSGIIGTNKADEALVRSLRDDLDTLRNAAGASDQQTQSTLGSVHELLGKVVDRLNRLEQETTEATTGRSVEPVITRADPLAATPGDNRPLEPGSGRPDLAALRELAAATAPAEKKPTDRRADFIAAARRAAQAAAAEAAATANEAPVEKQEAREAKQSAFARIGQAIRNRRRPLLLAAAAIVLAIGALQIFARIADDGEPQIAAAKPGAVEKAPAVRDIVAEAGVVPSLAGAKDSALVAPTAKDSTEIAFASPDAFDNSFGAGADPLETEAFAAKEAPVASVATSEIEMPAETATPGPDVPTGSDKLIKAAESGDSAAAFEVAARYAEGNGVSQNLAKAAEWYERAAEGGVAVAQYRLGSLYERGQGVQKDLTAAVNWYQRAADQGNIGAMHNLAVLMSEGVEGTPDHAKALQWFLAAGNYGVKDSQYNLGVIFARGLGTNQDLIESYKWFAVAAQQGDTDAAGRRDEVAKVLSPDDLAKARAAVQAWHVKPPLAEANGVSAPAGGWDQPSGSISELDRQGLVKKIQALLLEQGYDPGPADGLEGPKTRQAVMAFQKRIGLAETGQIDGTLVAAIEDMAG